tara:strand:- start:171 stop:782 length:612 start_codon:yes stop_codon:yes gene_type:complete
MKIYIMIFLFFLTTSCTSTNKVYWCGDHPCINKKEKEAYFKKTMIVEIRNIDDNKKKSSEIEKLIEQAHKDEKKRILKEKSLEKQAKLKEKRKIKEEKELAKQAKLEEKRKIKEEKELAKQAKLEEKRRIKEDKELEKKIKKDKKKVNKVKNNEIIKKQKKTTEVTSNSQSKSFSTQQFNELVEKITKKNSFKEFPDINDIPN